MTAPPNRKPFDRFSIVHAALGALAHASRVPVMPALVGAVIFELIENPLKQASEGVWPDAAPDGWQNSAGDVAAFAAGYLGSRAVSGTPAGRPLVTGLAAAGAAIWLWNLTNPDRA